MCVLNSLLIVLSGLLGLLLFRRRLKQGVSEVHRRGVVLRRELEKLSEERRDEDAALVVMGARLSQTVRIYEAARAQGKIVISHSCGSVVDIMPDMIEIGLDVLESVQPEARGMNPYELKRAWGDKITFWGCLGSQSTIPFGTPDEIRKRVKDLCEVMGKGGGYIVAPAHCIQPDTPLENVIAIYEEANGFPLE